MMKQAARVTETAGGTVLPVQPDWFAHKENNT
jgi:hypothetical protein